jgi:hypothetical protein
VTLVEDELKGRDEVANGAYKTNPAEVAVYDWNKVDGVFLVRVSLAYL